MNINETECTFTHEGKSWTNRGAYVDDNFALVYLQENPRRVTDWRGNVIGKFWVISEWYRHNQYGERYTMRAVRIQLDGGNVYHGRYGSDWSQLVRARRVK